MRGIFDSTPHFPVPSFEPVPLFPVAALPDCEPLAPVVTGQRVTFLGLGTSKMWRVDLSEVQASMVPNGLDPDGLKASENMVAESIPLLSSTTRAQLDVENTLMSVP